MKIEIPEKVRVLMVITERIGIPMILCVLFGYLYFVKLQRISEDLVTDRADMVLHKEKMKSNFESAKADHEEIKREVRRLGWSSGRTAR